MNKATIAGVVSEDPRQKKDHGGYAILEFPIVTERDYIDRRGDEKVYRARHNIVMYGRLAEKNAALIKKDMFIVIDGSLSYEHLENSDKGFRSEIIAKSVTIPPSRRT